MTLHKLVLLSILSLSGCATLDDNQTDMSVTSSPQGSAQLSASQNFQQQFKQKVTAQNTANQMAVANQQQSQLKTTAQSESIAELKAIVSQFGNVISEAQANQANQAKKPNINFYVQGLMQDLVSNLQYVNSTTPVAVVSFVMLDSDYTTSNLLGNQIAESLMHEIHKFGIPVIDFKTTDYIRVTGQGDFAFTRDYEEISANFPFLYIVGGTMLKQPDGYLINARIVGIESKAVVASAQSFIPNDVSNAILTSVTGESNEANSPIKDSKLAISAAKIEKNQNTSEPVKPENSDERFVLLIKE